MTWELYSAFVLATAVLIILPGPIVSLVIANSLTHGTRTGFTTVGGAQAAMVIQLTVVALGLTSIMAVMAEWFDWLRWVGAAYLIWLGIQKWRAKPLLPEERPSGNARGSAVFWQGFLVAMTNPKLLLFLAAFFPQFMDPTAPIGPAWAPPVAERAPIPATPIPMVNRRWLWLNRSANSRKALPPSPPRRILRTSGSMRSIARSKAPGWSCPVWAFVAFWSSREATPVCSSCKASDWVKMARPWSSNSPATLTTIR